MSVNDVSLQRRIEQFDLANGNDGIRVDGWVLFSNSASREVVYPYRFCGPPADEQHRAHLLVRYTEEKLKAAIRHESELRERNCETPQQRVDQFDQRHGRDSVPVNGYYVYSNGAQRDVNIMGAMIEPSRDLLERSQVQLRYHEKRLRIAVENFDTQRNQIDGHAKASLRHGTPPPDKGMLDKLRELQGIVQERQKDVAAARERVEQNIPESIKARAAARVEHMAGGERVIAELKEIRI